MHNMLEYLLPEDARDILTSAFLIVLRFPVLYYKYSPRYQFARDFYAIPRIDRGWEACPVKYRGTDRDALADYDIEPLLARKLLAEVKAEQYSTDLAGRLFAKCVSEGRVFDGLLRDAADAYEVLRVLGDHGAQYELIWIRQLGAGVPVPEGFRLLGIEYSHFVGDHFSASCDCMMIPRWHGTDDDGTLFLDHFRRLNQHGLFQTASDASEFFDYYCSLDWTENERSDYAMIEVFGRDEPSDAWYAAPGAPNFPRVD